MSGRYSPLLERAIRKAIALHETQRRKSGDVPYISHLFHVAMIIRAHGFPEHVVCAALLHDTIEDTNYTVGELNEDFGEPICSIVLDLTEDRHLKWDRRKQAYLDVVRAASREVKAVCCADKLHNLSTIIEDYGVKGEAVWRVFSRGREETMRFYRRALEAVSTDWDHPLIEEFRAVIDRAERTFNA